MAEKDDDVTKGDEGNVNAEDNAHVELDAFEETLKNEIEFGDEEGGEGEKSVVIAESVDKKVSGDKDGDKKKEPTVSDLAAKMEALEAKNAELDKAAKRAFYGERREKKAAKEKEAEAVLTDAEIKAIIKDNKDDPDVLFNAVTYKMQQMLKGGKKEAIDEVETKNKNTQLTAILRDRAADFDVPDSKSAEVISRAKEYFNLSDHPFSDFLAASAAVYSDLPNISKQWYEAGKKAALDESVDVKRKAEIKSGQITPGGKRSGGEGARGDNSTLSESEMETARMMGFDKNPQKMKIYRDQILRGSNKKAA